MRDTFNSRMDAAKAKAADRRSHGLHTGKQAKGWQFKRPDDDNPGELLSRKAWEYALDDFLEGVKFDVYGHQWEGL